MFLRGINVSGRRVDGAGLRSAFERLGFEDVQTFRNSGNVVLRAAEGAQRVAARVERGLKSELGFDAPAFVRTRAQIRAIAGHQPFSAAALRASKGKLQVALLADRPAVGARRRVQELATGKDELALRGRELYWLPHAGTQGSDIDMKAIDKAVGLNTIRTMGTIEQLCAKHFG